MTHTQKKILHHKENRLLCETEVFPRHSAYPSVAQYILTRELARARASCPQCSYAASWHTAVAQHLSVVLSTFPTLADTGTLRAARETRAPQRRRDARERKTRRVMLIPRASWVRLDPDVRCGHVAVTGARGIDSAEPDCRLMQPPH